MRYLTIGLLLLVAACGSKSDDKPTADAGAGKDAVALADGASATVSSSVFQALQCGHWPNHFGLVPPQSRQV